MADFSACAEALSSALDAPSLALRGRALARIGRAAEVVDCLRAIPASFNKAERGELCAIRAMSQIILGRNVEAESSLVDARGLVFSTGIAALEAEVLYLSAVLAWTESRHAEATEYIELTLGVDGTARLFGGRFSSEKPAMPLSYWRARAFELKSATEDRLERFAAQADWLVRALEEFDRGAVRDRYVEAAILYNAAVLVRDLELPELASYVVDRAEKFEWNDSLRRFEFLVFHVLGTRRAVEGNHLAALRCFRRSAECTSSIPLRMLAVLDRCRLMREIGETTTAAEEFEFAQRLATQIDWERVDGRERSALSLLARTIAPSEPRRARALFNRYLAIKSPVSRLELGTHHSRQYADDCFAEASIFRAEGEVKRSVTLLMEAFDIWSRIGYRWLRAQAACELAELTGEERFVRVAVSEAARYPNSSIARRVRGTFPSYDGESVAL